MPRRWRRTRRTPLHVVMSDEDIAAEPALQESSTEKPPSMARRRRRRTGPRDRGTGFEWSGPSPPEGNGASAPDPGDSSASGGSHHEPASGAANALTVFRSPEIESFPVRLLGPGPAGGGQAGQDILLGRAEGPRIAELGGVPSGASGSPVMVDGRTIGALAYVFPPDFSLVGITPIEAMLALTREPGARLEQAPESEPPSAAAQGGEAARSSAATQGGEAARSSAAPQGGEAARSSAPRQGGEAAGAGGERPAARGSTLVGRFLLPVANGFQHPAARDILARHLGVAFPAVDAGVRRRLVVHTDRTPAAGFTRSTALEAGSPVGVGLLVGDLRVGVIGTVTLVREQQVFAFGHPVFFTGPSQLPLTDAVILATARGSEPEKVGDIGAVIGTVTQDRAAGILAQLDQSPPLVQLRYCVYDRDRGRTEVLLAGAAANRALLPMLASVAAREAMVRAMNRIGEGAAVWEWLVSVSGLAEPVRRQEVAYDAADIGALVAESVTALLEQLLEQGFTVTAIDLSARVEMTPPAPVQCGG